MAKVHALSETTASGMEQKSFGGAVTPVFAIFSELSFASFDIGGMSPVSPGLLDKSRAVSAVRLVPMHAAAVIGSRRPEPRRESCCSCGKLHSCGSTGVAAELAREKPCKSAEEMPHRCLG